MILFETKYIFAIIFFIRLIKTQKQRAQYTIYQSNKRIYFSLNKKCARTQQTTNIATHKAAIINLKYARYKKNKEK